MARIKLDLPERFPFSTELRVRITDVNYGGHMGNDSLLGLLHEARVRFLEHYALKRTGHLRPRADHGRQRHRL